MNKSKQTELPHVDMHNLPNSCGVNHLEFTKPLVIFLNSRKEVLSSAPTSPNSSDGEANIPISSVKFRYTKDSRKCFRKITSSSQTNWRKRHGMTLHCGPFFSRMHNGLLNSPYQSDVSQSAPSSPTMDTYETTPLIPNTSTIPQNNESKHFNATVHSNSLCTDYKTDDNQCSRSSCVNNNFEKYSESTLLCLMQRLGVQSVWPRLLEHGVVDVNRLSKLTRNELIEMGVTDAETRATLMTAAQLLTDSWLNCSLLHKTLNRSTVQTTKDSSDAQNIHDSGISSGTDITSSCLTYRPQFTNVCSMNEVRNCHNVMSSDKFNLTEQHQSKWIHEQNLCTEYNSSVQMAAYDEINLNTPSKQNHVSYQTMNSNKNSLRNVSNAFDEIHNQSKHPVSILRNGRLSRDCQIDTDNVKRSSSTTPKTVKIDERFLSTSRQQQQQQQHQQMNESNLLNVPLLQLPSQLMPTSYFVQFPHRNQHQTISEDVKNIYIQHIQLARHILRRKLTAEHIDLTQPPYSDETGHANIPLRLTQRYSFETNLDLMTVAMALEAERDANLREIRRPVISFNEEIQSQRFLNCDGIKTGSLQEFLITIGLPMYINHILHYSNITTTTNNNSSINSGNKNTNHQSIIMTPADLLNMSDCQLQEKFNFLPIHIQWLRQEASVIPWILLGQLNSSKNSSITCTSNNIHSLQHNFNTNSCCRRSSSQLRKIQQQQQQQQQQEKRPTVLTQPFISQCQHSSQHQHHHRHHQHHHEEQQQLDNLKHLEHIVDKV
ncbi:SAM and SH3 domain-containing protein [Schistosoma japonicum]|nr:SAM and SH3 domain-containing protein [Schistosoma japonicum]